MAHSPRIDGPPGSRRGRPAWLHALDLAGRPFHRWLPFDADAIWERAAAAEPDAPAPARAAVEALRALSRSVRDDAALDTIGRVSGQGDTLRMARTHLRIEKALRADPAIASTPLPDPVFIVGWPRTGSTFLHVLLAQDPQSRCLPYWESFDPVPPAAGPDRRVQRLDAMLAQLARIAPDYQAIHPMTAQMPEECVALFMNVFRTLQFDIQYRVPGYVEWLLAQDARIAYRAYRRQLALVQHHRPHGERWILKDPTHIVHLDALIATFPDARFIFTHRDPAAAMSSMCSLYAHTRAIFSAKIDPHAIGREIFDGYWPRALERAQQVRETIPAGRRADVRYEDFVRDPVGTAQTALRSLGIGIDEPGRLAMQRFAARDAATDRGVHRHALGDYGLEAGAVRESFDAYVDRFGLRPR